MRTVNNTHMITDGIVTSVSDLLDDRPIAHVRIATKTEELDEYGSPKYKVLTVSVDLPEKMTNRDELSRILPSRSDHVDVLCSVDNTEDHGDPEVNYSTLRARPLDFGIRKRS